MILNRRRYRRCLLLPQSTQRRHEDHEGRSTSLCVLCDSLVCFVVKRNASGFQMTSRFFRIAGGTVYDPANGIDGEVRDVWIDGDRIAAAPGDPSVRPERTLDATGLVVMPGGIDM